MESPISKAKPCPIAKQINPEKEAFPPGTHMVQWEANTDKSSNTHNEICYKFFNCESTQCPKMPISHIMANDIENLKPSHITKCSARYFNVYFKMHCWTRNKEKRI